MSDLITAPLNLIRTFVGGISSGSQTTISFFDPFYNLVVILWMAAIVAILVRADPNTPLWYTFSFVICGFEHVAAYLIALACILQL